MSKHQPKFREEPKPQKQPRIGSDTSYGKFRPSWRVTRLEVVHPFGWHEIGAICALQVRSKLANFESMTWNDIFVTGNKQNHAVKVQKICAEAKKRLRELKLDDLDELWRLRVMGKQRVWGILQEGVFMLLWWDPEHLVYPYELPNT